MADQQPQRPEQETGDQRFERTVRNLLSTPPKPHKEKEPPAKAERQPRMTKRGSSRQ